MTVGIPTYKMWEVSIMIICHIWIGRVKYFPDPSCAMSWTTTHSMLNTFLYLIATTTILILKFAWKKRKPYNNMFVIWIDVWHPTPHSQIKAAVIDHTIPVMNMLCLLCVFVILLKTSVLEETTTVGNWNSLVVFISFS